MKTKDKILETALKLFNQEGVDQVTPRRIATEMGISHGNLRYHFSKKEEILYALYMQLVSAFDQAIIETQGKPSLKMAYELLKLVYYKLDEHRYLMIDFVSIMRQVPAIRIHYQALFQARKLQFAGLFEALRADGTLQPEMFPGQYEHVLLQLTIFSDFWVGAAEIHFQHLKSNKVDYFIKIALSMLFPYLTEKGRKAFHELYGSLD